MLEILDSEFTILARQGPANKSDLVALRTRYLDIPDEYLLLAGEATEIELQHSSGQYVRIWGPSGCIEMDEGYEVSKFIPGAIPIGDNGGGKVIFYLHSVCKPGLYHVGYGNLDMQEAVFLSTSLRSFLERAEGIGTFRAVTPSP